MRLLPALFALGLCGAAAAQVANAPFTITVATSGGSGVVRNIVTDFGATCNGAGDDSAAFTAFNTWARTQTVQITLTIPSGSVCVFNAAGGGNWIARGVKNLLVSGYGATFSDNNGAGNGWFLGGFGVIADSAHSARLATVAAGSSCVSLLNPTQTGLFHVGNYTMISGIDMMGYGYPPNPYFYEFVQVTSASGGTVCFGAPLKYGYKSTWPLYNPGSDFEADQGGPATLYALDPSWDIQVEYDGLTFRSPGQTYANGRSVTFKDVTFTGGACAVPSQNMNWTVINGNFSSCDMEVDKIVTNATLNNVTIRQILFQNSSVDLFTLTNSRVTNTLNGTPKTFVGVGSTIANFSPGAYAYGITSEVSCANCVINAMTPLGFLGSPPTMSGGVITVPNADGTSPWAIPGANLSWKRRYAEEPQTFQVIDVTQDATNTYIHTSLPGGFPPPLSNAPGIAPSVRTHPAPKFTCTNCTGSADAVDLSGAPPGAPLWSYSKRTYTGTTPSALVPVWGTLVSAKFNVTTVSTGGGVVKFNLDGPFIIAPDGVAVSIWDPTINSNVAGLRTITPAGVIGAQPGDSLSTPGASWLLDNQITEQFSGTPSTGTSVTVEIITNQGVVNR